MKKIQSLILALPLIVAAAFVSCSDENIDTPAPQPEQQAVTFTASIPQTRVAYDINGENAIKCTWDNNDLNKTVVFQNTFSYNNNNDIGVATFNFRITKIEDGVATLAYTGVSSFPDDYTGSKDFPATFTGTATYTTNAEQSQNAATSTGHLNNGTKLVVNLESAAPGSNIKFKHATSVYRITFNAPKTISASAHPTLSVETQNGVFGQISLGFNMTEGQSYTVYLHGDPQGATSRLTFRLDYERDDSHVQIYDTWDNGDNKVVANQKNPAMNLYLDGQTLQRKWWENHLTWVKGMSFPNS